MTAAERIAIGRVFVSRHAVERYAEFYPAAEIEDIEAEVADALPIERAAATALAQGAGMRRARNDHATYLLHRERTGVFVVSALGVVVTFLRFYGLQQHEAATKLWPGGPPPTCDTPWARHLEREREKRAARVEVSAARKAEKKRERQQRGLEQAAALLRRNGWTCVPPGGEP